MTFRPLTSAASARTPQTPPTILFACADDPLVPIANDRLMFAALQKAGVSSEYHEYPTGGHAWGFRAVPDKSPPGWLDVTLYAWLKKMGFVFASILSE